MFQACRVNARAFWNAEPQFRFGPEKASDRIWKNFDWLVAHNPETGTTTQGKTFEEAPANLKEATELYLSEFPQATKGRAILTTFEVSSLAHA